MKIEIYVTTKTSEDLHLQRLIDEIRKCWESLTHVQIGRGPISAVRETALRLLKKGVIGALGKKYVYDSVSEGGETRRRLTINLQEGAVADTCKLYEQTCDSIGKRVAPYIAPLIDAAAEIADSHAAGREKIAADYAVKPQFGYILVERHIDAYIGVQMVKRDSADTAVTRVGTRAFFGKCKDPEAFDRIIEDRLAGSEEDSGIVWMSAELDETRAREAMLAVGKKRWENWRTFYLAKVKVSSCHGNSIPVVIAKWPDNTQAFVEHKRDRSVNVEKKVKDCQCDIIGGPYANLTAAKKALDTIEAFNFGS